MPATNRNISSLLFPSTPAYAAALAGFRIVFGLMLLGSMVRFWLKGWIEELYVQPKFFFHYYGFDWLPAPGNYTYLLFFVCGLSALFFALGLFYRFSSVILFLSFTYIELLDKTNYLNHYYFVSLALFLMIWLPAHVSFSLDGIRKPELKKRLVPLWTIGSIRLLLGMVYLYAGLAKLNSDWLLQAMPLKLWLPAKNDVPFVGPLFNYEWVAYAFSWFGALYDLSIPFLLLNRRTRPYAFLAVIVFHVLTAMLFPIGMFPYIMILAATIFFDSKDWDKLLTSIKQWLGNTAKQQNNVYEISGVKKNSLVILFVVFFSFQAVFPWRYLMTPGELFWTEEGYRFSWRVMLMEKMGYAQFVVKDGVTGEQVAVNNNDFLTKNQEKMMATQSDFIIQYAHILKKHFVQEGMKKPEVYATVYVSLNGRRSRLFVDPHVDLAQEKETFKHKRWILDMEDKIYGL